MRLDQLQLTNFRVFDRLSVQGFARLNVLHGANGSGKSSLLEALYLLSLGRSFRTHDPKAMIRDGAAACTVSGVFLDSNGPLSVGVERYRSEAKPRVRVNGESQTRLSALAQRVPMRVLDSQSLEFIASGPGARRSFLDWGVFHVEHAFQHHWQAARHALKQRNALLRSGRINAVELGAWEHRLAQEAAILDDYRAAFCETLVGLTATLLSELSPVLAAQEPALAYRRGWPADRSLTDVLAQHRQSDVALGHTQLGPHRADLRVTVHGRKAQDALSRGQQKLLAVALYLAQIQLVERHSGKPLIVLVDDLAAELDREHRTAVIRSLSAQGDDRQLFISGTDIELLAADLAAAGNEEARLFHVEHGQVTPQKDNAVIF
ncbi:MAG: DNA replication/repair protein RecF [Spongiibacteraceae bacterium]|nr:DNA replication/repair protein RecF [Spongiibacteraceae bacterium]